jgi:hypothetical protein
MRRMPSRIVAAAVLVLATAVVHVAAAPGQAQARCDGANEVKSQIVNSTGAVLAEEWPKPGACNSNNTYVGYIRSRAAGWQATVWIQNDGVWRGWSCPSGRTCEYSYIDGNYHSYIHLCISTQSLDTCGWGREIYHYFTHRAYGVNWAY